MIDQTKLHSSLLKKALGYEVDEITEEYNMDEDSLKLIKRKVVKKHIPPDYSAVKVLCEYFNNDMDLEDMTETELQEEKRRLLEQLKTLD